MIRALTEKEVKDLFTFREVLETAVVGQVVPMLTDKIFNEIEAILLKHRKAAEEGNTLSSLVEDRAFHLHLAKLTKNSFFINALEDVRDLVDLAGMRTLEVKDRMGESVAEHHAIASMMKSGHFRGS